MSEEVEPTNDAVKTSKTSMILKVMLTQDERLALSESIAREFSARIECEAEMKEVASTYKGKIAAHDSQIGKTANANRPR